MQHHYAQRVQSFASSATRKLFDMTISSDVISVAGGNPDLSLLPAGRLASTASELVSGSIGQVLQYGATGGRDGYKLAAQRAMAAEGIAADTSEILALSGSQLGLELATKVFCDPGDVILTEDVAYPGALSSFLAYETVVDHVACDAEGVRPEAFAEAIAAHRSAGRAMKLFYTVPNFHNPAGRTTSLERRLALIELCREHGILVLEDNPYGLISFGAAPLPSYWELAKDITIYLGTFSKTVAPGLRTGWLCADAESLEYLETASEAISICPSPLNQAIVESFVLDDAVWEGHLATIRRAYEERRDATVSALAEHLPEGTRWVTPTGGFYVWVDLDERYDSNEIFPRAVAEGVLFVPGRAFTVEGTHAHSLRLAYSMVAPERLAEAVARLGRAIRG